MARRDAVESADPSLEPAVVGTHVLDVIIASDDSLSGRHMDRPVSDADLLDRCGTHAAPVIAEDGIGGEDG